MDDAGLTSKLEPKAPLASKGPPGPGDGFDRTRAMFNAGFRYWQAECLRFVDEAAADSQAAYARLRASKTPLDVLAAEHEWLRARSRSWLQAGVRLVNAIPAAPRSPDREGAGPSRKTRETA